jgi:DNA-binding XRE family transcriptional regulator
MRLMPKQDETLAAFGRNVAKFRNERGFSQDKLAEGANLDRTYLSGIERGVRNPVNQTGQSSDLPRRFRDFRWGCGPIADSIRVERLGELCLYSGVPAVGLMIARMVSWACLIRILKSVIPTSPISSYRFWAIVCSPNSGLYR